MEHDNAGTANATADEGNMDELFNSAIRLRRYGVSEGAALSMLNLGCINMASGDQGGYEMEQMTKMMSFGGMKSAT